MNAFGLSVAELDWTEINEMIAGVQLSPPSEFSHEMDTLNQRGGAIAPQGIRTAEQATVWPRGGS